MQTKFNLILPPTQNFCSNNNIELVTNNKHSNVPFKYLILHGYSVWINHFVTSEKIINLADHSIFYKIVKFYNAIFLLFLLPFFLLLLF